MNDELIDTPALNDPRLAEITHDIVVHGPVSSLGEAAAARRMKPSQLIKTMVVRRSDNDYVFVLVPGDRIISWPKLRRHLGVSRLSMPDADEAKRVTGYARGTITPFGAATELPVIADQSLEESLSIGGGAHGVSITVDRADLIEILDASTAEVTEPAE